MEIEILPANPTEQQRDAATRQLQQWLIDHNFAIQILTVETPPPPPPPLD